MRRILQILIGGTLLGAVAFFVTHGGSDDAVAAAPTTTSPAATATTEPRGRLVIHGVGDVNTDTDYIPALAEHGHAHAWSGLGDLFTADDLTVANLECTPSELGTPLRKEFVFRCDLGSLPVMREAGVDVVSLANNHAGDHGKEALLDGIQQVEAAGLHAVGVGANAQQATQPVIVDVNGWRVAVLGFGGVIPALDWLATDDRAGMADGDTIETMVAAVEAAAEISDLVVVTIHWGVERDLEPRAEDRERAEAMIAAGADVIFGHHAHRLQPLEVVDGAPVAWGLGNFVWPNLSQESATTAIARVVVEPDGTKEACLIPAFISSPGRPEIIGDAPC
ncbi:MAG TPA: CapA family protein [Acidimicrobiia bacterium]|jgi:poly-gamma-glutamate capsule biosynthesis protein CapA/YwtB (metallophosphatase superfamily)